LAKSPNSGCNEEPGDKRSVLQTASDGIMMMSNDEANRMIYEARLKAQQDEYSRLQGAIREGRKEGEKEGRKEVARTLKALGDPVEKIALSTGLSPMKSPRCKLAMS
jgi:predicted transposase/invertase (TIGR01784 family)